MIDIIRGWLPIICQISGEGEKAILEAVIDTTRRLLNEDPERLFHTPHRLHGKLEPFDVVFEEVLREYIERERKGSAV